MKRRKYDEVTMSVERERNWDHLAEKGLPSVNNKQGWYKLVQAMVGYVDLEGFSERLTALLQKQNIRSGPASLMLLGVQSRYAPLLTHALASAICREARRADDLVTAIEGNLFAVILPGTDDEGALSVVTRVLPAFRQEATTLGLVDEGSLGAGIAKINLNEEFSPEKLVERAEKLLNRALGAEMDAAATETGLLLLGRQI